MTRYYNRTNTCDKCGKDLISDACPRREYNKEGNWTGRWLCNACHHKYKYHGTYDKEEIDKKKIEISQKRKEDLSYRRCSRCGNDTYIDDNGHHQWFKEYRNGNWDGKSYICKFCYDLNKRKDPNSWYNIVKQIVTNRYKKIIDISDFNNLDNQQKGLLIEILVCRTIKAINRNIREDNFKSKTDTLYHNIYGWIEIKGSSFHNDRNRWIFVKLLGRKFDNLIAVCMDSEQPWTKVERVYIIPLEQLYEKDSIRIYSDYSEFENFRVDEKLYNNTWQEMLKERYITVKEE